MCGTIFVLEESLEESCPKKQKTVGRASPFEQILLE